MSDVNITWNGANYFRLAEKATVKAMKTAALLVENRAKKIMGTGASKFNASGDTKKRKGKKSFHRPSAPGFPPNIDSGALRSSIQSRVQTIGMTVNGFVGSDKEKLAKKAAAGTDLEYGFYLEVGAPAINLKPRPWLRPALRQSERDILKILRGGVGDFKGKQDFSGFVGPTNQ